MEFPADLSSPPGSRTGSSGTLAREGIMSTVFTGTGRVGRAVTLRDQDKIEIPSLERRKLNVSPIPLRGLTNKAAKSVLIPTAPSSSSSDYLPRSQWLSLGDGWFQATAPSSGSSSRCGLHSVIESRSIPLFPVICYFIDCLSFFKVLVRSLYAYTSHVLWQQQHVLPSIQNMTLKCI